MEPVFVAYTKEMPYTGKMKPGVNAVTTDDIRWLRCNIKSLNLLGNIMAKQQAMEAGCDEAIQHRDGTVTEEVRQMSQSWWMVNLKRIRPQT